MPRHRRPDEWHPAPPGGQRLDRRDNTLTTPQMLLGLRTVIYQVPDLAKAKDWYGRMFGIKPYFDEPFYVGYNVGGYELGLHPEGEGERAAAGGSTAYWGVKDLRATMQKLAADNVKVPRELQDVGDGILVATIEDPFGNHIGLIENPHFSLPQWK
jgi:predicted enzyme related to lactoylglutathione lyase